MIKSFKCKYTKQLFDSDYQEKFSQTINNIAKRKLDMLEVSFNEDDLKVPPSSSLERLKGFYNIRIDEQFRLIFKFKNSNAYDVYIDNYHK